MKALPKEPPAWVNEYIGIPFVEKGRDRNGLDCWGLIRLVWKERAGMSVPSYVDDYMDTNNQDVLGALFKANMGDEWFEVAPGRERLFDGLLLRVRGEPMHVGLVVARGLMLHIMRGIDCALERYNSLVWKKRIIGIYRHEYLETR